MQAARFKNRDSPVHWTKRAKSKANGLLDSQCKISFKTESDTMADLLPGGVHPWHVLDESKANHYSQLQLPSDASKTEQTTRPLRSSCFP